MMKRSQALLMVSAFLSEWEGSRLDDGRCAEAIVSALESAKLMGRYVSENQDEPLAVAAHADLINVDGNTVTAVPRMPRPVFPSRAEMRRRTGLQGVAAVLDEFSNEAGLAQMDELIQELESQALEQDDSF